MNETVAKQSGSEPDRLVDLEELRRLAEQATPGPWTWDVREDWLPQGTRKVARLLSETEHLKTYPGIRKRVLEQESWYVFPDEADRDYIAAANPATILSLLDRYELAHVDLQAAEQRVAALEEGLRAMVAACEQDNLWQLEEALDKARSLLQSSAARLAPPLRGSQGDEE